ncbi:MAG: DUF72 domain-containing protein [Flammeovirgaceae bacterium]
MKFGKLSDISTVDFSLPIDHPQTAHVLAKATTEQKAPIYFGCPAWGCKDWVGKIYPPKTKSADFLTYYAKQFNTIELNTTHYRIPTVDTVRKWVEKAGRGFKFCPKIPQSISHFGSNLQKVDHLVEDFALAIHEMGALLGICFMQLPPHFSPKHAPHLIRFVENFPLPLSIEFRHPDWFTPSEAVEQVFEAMKKHQVATVITDVAGRRDVCHMRLTSPVAVIRFVGNDLHPTDFSRLDVWMERLKAWQGAGLQEIYFFLHEPDDVHCPELAEQFIAKANTTLELNLKPIRFYNQEVQGTLF